MNRRDFITMLSGTAAWPLAARAQQGERMRRIAVLAGGASDEDRQERNTAFVQALQNLGWTVGRNVQIDYRTASGGLDALRRYAAEIVALAPDVILTSGSVSMAPLLRATRGSRTSARRRPALSGRPPATPATATSTMCFRPSLQRSCRSGLSA